MGDDYSPLSLPIISVVEVIPLRGVFNFVKDCSDRSGQMVHAADAQKIAHYWRQLPAGEQARCHIPPFGLRFVANGKVICQGSICWECNNIHGESDGISFAYSFDGDSEIAQSLLSELRRYCPE